MAGVIVILSLIVQMLSDCSALMRTLAISIRVAVPLSAIPIGRIFLLHYWHRCSETEIKREQERRRGPGRILNLSASAALLPALLLAGCADHYLLHPRQPPAGAQSWNEVAVDGDLQMRLEWVRPADPGPLPAVIVHPEAGHKATDMRGVLHDLAKAGYLAVAADYQRRTGTRWRESLFPWRDPADPRRVIDRVRAHPDVDPRHIGLLGFSQGGVLSLLIAAYDGGADAVVAYYPVTDFESWLEAAGTGLGRRLVFRLIRAGFRRASGARSDAELQALLRRASPLRQVESIKSPGTPRARRPR